MSIFGDFVQVGTLFKICPDSFSKPEPLAWPKNRGQAAKIFYNSGIKYGRKKYNYRHKTKIVIEVLLASEFKM